LLNIKQVQQARKWDLHRTIVAEHLQRIGVETRLRGIPSSQLDEAIRLYKSGWSCQQLADRFSCDDETVRQTLKRNGVSLHGHGNATARVKRTFALTHCSSLSMSQTASSRWDSQRALPDSAPDFK
jgi:hypothetical protein